MSGFALIYRDVYQHELFKKDFKRASAWVYLFTNACWRSSSFNARGAMVTIERGQLCVSRSQLAAAWDWTESAVDRFLKRLEKERMIERRTEQGRTIITICNYDLFQADSGHSEREANGQPNWEPNGNLTTKEQGNNGTRIPIGIPNPLPPEPANDEDAPKSKPHPRAKPKPNAKAKPKLWEVPAFDFPNWWPIEAWSRFVQHRRELKKPITPTALERTVAKLREWNEEGQDPAAVLDQSVRNQWTGIFPLKEQTHGNTNIRSRVNGAGYDHRDGFERALDAIIFADKPPTAG